MTGKKSSSRLSDGLCSCVSFWFWREIGSFFVVAGKFYYNRKKKFMSFVWRVVLLCQFLVLAGNRFWLYILLCTWSNIRLFSVVAGKFYYDQKKMSSRLSGGLCCCVSFWFWREIGSFFVVAGKFYYDRKKKVRIVCLAGCAVVSVFGSGGK
jgi:hypothetical protein